jgi:hypothetical protein
MNTVARALAAIKVVEAKFQNIQANPALNGAENGLTNQELELLERLIAMCGEATIAGNEIAQRALSPGQKGIDK